MVTVAALPRKIPGASWAALFQRIPLAMTAVDSSTFTAPPYFA